MPKEEKKKKISLTNVDLVETPEEIISADKDLKRKEAFAETYKRIATIIPEYFMTQRRKRKNGSSGGTSFTQNIVVTPDKVTVQTNEVENVEEKNVEEEKTNDRERED